MNIELARQEIERRHAATGDRSSRIWVLDPRRSSPFLRGSLSFGPEEARIDVIDPFDGREPFCVDMKLLEGGNSFNFVPTVLLDSQLLSYLEEFLNPTGKQPHARRRAVHNFLDWVVLKRYDYNPVFYLLESIAKDANATASRWLPRAMLTILKLHTMDENEFQRSGRVIPDRGKVERYEDEDQETSLEAVATKRAREIYESGRRWLYDLIPIHDVSYAVLLKIGMLHKTRGLSISEKYAALEDFLINRVRRSMARELCLALFHFAGRTGSFITFEKSLGLEGVRRKLKGSAWDLFLLRLPEFLILQNDPLGYVIAYPCTIEKPLQFVGRSVHLRAVGGLHPRERWPIPVLETDLNELTTTLGEAVIADVLARNQQYYLTTHRRAFASDPGQETDIVDPTDLVAEMEEEAERLLR